MFDTLSRIWSRNEVSAAVNEPSMKMPSSRATSRYSRAICSSCSLVVSAVTSPGSAIRS
jgi:hypothetical protein